MASDQFGNYQAGLESAGKTIYSGSGDGSPVGVITPTADEGMYTDNLTGDRWQWSGAAWTLLPVQTDSIP